MGSRKPKEKYSLIPIDGIEVIKQHFSSIKSIINWNVNAETIVSAFGAEQRKLSSYWSVMKRKKKPENIRWRKRLLPLRMWYTLRRKQLYSVRTYTDARLLQRVVLFYPQVIGMKWQQPISERREKVLAVYKWWPWLWKRQSIAERS